MIVGWPLDEENAPALPAVEMDTGTRPLTYSVDGTLPDGVTFDPQTRRLVGTPAAGSEQELTEYTYVVTDSARPNRQAKAVFRIAVEADTQPELSAIDDVVFVSEQAEHITLPSSPANKGNRATNRPLPYKLTPALPAGLSLANPAGEVWQLHWDGRELSADIASATYTWTATDVDGDEAMQSFDVVVYATRGPYYLSSRNFPETPDPNATGGLPSGWTTTKPSPTLDRSVWRTYARYDKAAALFAYDMPERIEFATTLVSFWQLAPVDEEPPAPARTTDLAAAIADTEWLSIEPDPQRTLAVWELTALATRGTWAFTVRKLHDPTDRGEVVVLYRLAATKPAQPADDDDGDIELAIPTGWRRGDDAIQPTATLSVWTTTAERETGNDVWTFTDPIEFAKKLGTTRGPYYLHAASRPATPANSLRGGPPAVDSTTNWQAMDLDRVAGQSVWTTTARFQSSGPNSGFYVFDTATEAKGRTAYGPFYILAASRPATPARISQAVPPNGGLPAADADAATPDWQTTLPQRTTLVGVWTTTLRWESTQNAYIYDAATEEQPRIVAVIGPFWALSAATPGTPSPQAGTGVPDAPGTEMTVWLAVRPQATNTLSVWETSGRYQISGPNVNEYVFDAPTEVAEKLITVLATPTGLMASPTSTTAALSWDASTPAAGVDDYTVEVKKSLVSNWDNADAHTASGTTLDITGLDPSTFYDFRVRANPATQAYRVSEWAEATFLTLVAIIKLQPPSQPVAGPGDTSTRLEWTAPVSDAGIAHYAIQYRVVGVASWTTITVGGTATTITTVASTDYEWTIQSIAANTATHSDSDVIDGPDWTTLATKLLPPDDLEAIAITDAGATLSWDAPADATGVAGYEVRYREKGEAGFRSPVSTQATTTRLVLDRNTEYEWTVRAIAGAGYRDSDDATVLSFSTDKTQLTDPVNLDETGVAHNTATLEWDGSTPAGGVASYEVEFKKQADSAWTTRSTQGTSLALTGLDTNTGYNWRVRALAGTGYVNSGFSVAAFTTTSQRLSTPSNFGLFDDEDGSLFETNILLGWGISFPVSELGGYLIEYRVAGTNAWVHGASRGKTAPAVQLVGLSAGETYEFRIQATPEADSTYQASLYATATFTMKGEKSDDGDSQVFYLLHDGDPGTPANATVAALTDAIPAPTTTIAGVDTAWATDPPQATATQGVWETTGNRAADSLTVTYSPPEIFRANDSGATATFYIQAGNEPDTPENGTAEFDETTQAYADIPAPTGWSGELPDAGSVPTWSTTGTRAPGSEDVSYSAPQQVPTDDEGDTADFWIQQNTTPDTPLNATVTLTGGVYGDIPTPTGWVDEEPDASPSTGLWKTTGTRAVGSQAVEYSTPEEISAPVNQPPIVGEIQGASTIRLTAQLAQYDYSVVATDPEKEALTYSWSRRSSSSGGVLSEPTDTSSVKLVVPQDGRVGLTLINLSVIVSDGANNVLKEKAIELIPTGYNSQTPLYYLLSVDMPAIPRQNQNLSVANMASRGWSTTEPDPTASEAVWATRGRSFVAGERFAFFWTAPYLVEPATGDMGGSETVFRLAATTPSYTDGNRSSPFTVPTGWTADKPDPTATQNVYELTFLRARGSSTWVPQTVTEAAAAMADSGEVTTFFIRASSKPSAPTAPSSVTQNSDGTWPALPTPSGWSASSLNPTPLESVWATTATRAAGQGTITYSDPSEEEPSDPGDSKTFWVQTTSQPSTPANTVVSETSGVYGDIPTPPAPSQGTNWVDTLPSDWATVTTWSTTGLRQSGSTTVRYSEPVQTVSDNIAPTLTLSAQGTTIKGRGTVTVAASAADADGTIASYAWSTDLGTITASSSGTSANFKGPDTTGVAQTATISCTIADNDGGKATASLSINISADGGDSATFYRRGSTAPSKPSSTSVADYHTAIPRPSGWLVDNPGAIIGQGVYSVTGSRAAGSLAVSYGTVSEVDKAITPPPPDVTVVSTTTDTDTDRRTVAHPAGGQRTYSQSRSRTRTQTNYSDGSVTYGSWGAWSAWSPAAPTAGGSRTETDTDRRTVAHPAGGQRTYSQSRSRTRSVTDWSDGVTSYGTWSSWSAWSPAAPTAGGSRTETETESRLRAHPAGGGRTYSQSRSRTRSVTDWSDGVTSYGVWSVWSAWSPSSPVQVRLQPETERQTRWVRVAGGQGGEQEQERTRRRSCVVYTDGVTACSLWSAWSGWTLTGNTRP